MKNFLAKLIARKVLLLGFLANNFFKKVAYHVLNNKILDKNI